MAIFKKSKRCFVGKASARQSAHIHDRESEQLDTGMLGEAAPQNALLQQKTGKFSCKHPSVFDQKKPSTPIQQSPRFGKLFSKTKFVPQHFHRNLLDAEDLSRHKDHLK